MIETITIDTDTHVVVPRVPTLEMVSAVDEYVGGHCFSCTPDKASEYDCRRVYDAMIAAVPQPEQAQLSDFDPIVPESALEVGAKAVELAMQAGVTSPRTLALAAYTDIALTLHKAGQQPAPRQIPPINQELDEFISGLVAKELAKRGSRKIETAPRPVPTDMHATILELCDTLENRDDIPLHKWALKSAMLVSKIRTGLTRPAEPDGGAV
jgi:hypothetical protein